MTGIAPLGLKDHSVAAQGLDASDKDKAINIAQWPVKGMYQPDSIASYAVKGKTFLVTANEGDARDYDCFAEEKRVKDLTLDPVAFPSAAALQEGRCARSPHGDNPHVTAHRGRLLRTARAWWAIGECAGSRRLAGVGLG